MRRNLNHNSYSFFQENSFENIGCKMAAILSRPQCAIMRRDCITSSGELSMLPLRLLGRETSPEILQPWINMSKLAASQLLTMLVLIAFASGNYLTQTNASRELTTLQLTLSTVSPRNAKVKCTTTYEYITVK